MLELLRSEIKTSDSKFLPRRSRLDLSPFLIEIKFRKKWNAILNVIKYNYEKSSATEMVE